MSERFVLKNIGINYVVSLGGADEFQFNLFEVAILWSMAQWSYAYRNIVLVISFHRVTDIFRQVFVESLLVPGFKTTVIFKTYSLVLFLNSNNYPWIIIHIFFSFNMGNIHYIVSGRLMYRVWTLGQEEF